MWNYAELSRMAKALGGPEILIETLTRRGIEIGAIQAKTKYGIFGLALVASAGIVGYFIGVNKLKSKKQQITAVEAAATEQALIYGIKAYDNEVADNPDAEPLPDMTREEAEAKIDQYVQEIADEMNSDVTGGSSVSINNSQIVGNLLFKYGIDVVNVRRLNLILEKMGIITKTGNGWLTGKEGMKYTIYKCPVFRPDLWLPEIVDAVAAFIKKQ